MATIQRIRNCKDNVQSLYNHLIELRKTLNKEDKNIFNEKYNEYFLEYYNINLKLSKYLKNIYNNNFDLTKINRYCDWVDEYCYVSPYADTTEFNLKEGDNLGDTLIAGAPLIY